MKDRYLRNFNTINLAEQKRLYDSKVCIIGLGGLGGGVAEMLARTGVGSLVLVDGDFFKESNLNRQILCTEELIGVSKADAAENRIKQINSSINIRKINSFLNGENGDHILAESDLVVDCLDSVEARFILQDAAKNAKIPIVSGAIAGTAGQVCTIFPDDPGFEKIYGKKGRKKAEGAEKILGTLSYTASFIAALQASEAVKVLLKKGTLLRNKLLIADLMSCSFEIVEV